MRRRDFLKAVTALPVAAFPSWDVLAQTLGPVVPAGAVPAGTTPALQGGVEPFWNYPRAVYMRRPVTGEVVKTVYFENGRLDMEGYRRLCWLLRDVHSGTAAWIDPRLLDLMCAVQAWVAAYGFREPIQVHSGYRTPATNNRTEGAARNSMHLQAKAIDFVLPGLPWDYVGQLAAHYAAGGVGFYPTKQFIHADTGRQRYWLTR